MGKTLKIIPYTSEDLDDVIKSAGKDNLDNNSWWYLHGDLERRCGYDKAFIYNMSDFPDEYIEVLEWREINGRETEVPEFIYRKEAHLHGIYPVEVYGVPEPCLGFFWITGERKITATNKRSGEKRDFMYWEQRGLVVLESDKEEVEYARKRYEENCSHL